MIEWRIEILQGLKMQKVIVQVKVVPLGTQGTSLSSYVAEVEKILAGYKDLKSMLTPMSTIIEGDIDQIFKVVREMHESPFLKGAKRVSTQLSIDDRRDKQASMQAKIKAVEDKLRTATRDGE
jgi:uncharacterized protein (TIGR00106 family)